MQDLIELAWEGRAEITAASAPDVRQAVDDVIGDLNAGRTPRCRAPGRRPWTVTHQWLKKAVLLSFRLSDNKLIQGGDAGFFDKVPTKFAHLDDEAMRATRRARGAAGRAHGAAATSPRTWC